MSDHNEVKCIPPKVQKFKFREKDMSKLLHQILWQNDGYTIVPVLGLAGIGKSSLIKNTLHFVSDRKYFTGGILYI